MERFSRIKDPSEVYEWIRQVKTVRPELVDFIELMAITGLRLEEAVNSYNMIINLSRKHKLNEYYNEASGVLEHYKFKDTFIRRSKKAFVSFASKDLIHRIAENEPLTSKSAVQARVKKKGLPLRFGDIREAHASFITKYLKQPEIDFLHGRVSTNIFMSNYFNPALIGDLKERTFKAIAEIQEKIS
jgi:intergrase/recombinase